MSDQKQAFIEYISRMLPLEEKSKAGEYVVVMEEYFQQMTNLMKNGYDEPRLPPMLRVSLMRRLIVLLATTIYLSEGVMSIIEAGKACAQNIVAAKAASELEKAKEKKIELVKG